LTVWSPSCQVRVAEVVFVREFMTRISSCGWEQGTDA
jgi:hypothetical protein